MEDALGVFAVLCFLAAFVTSILLTFVAKRMAVKFGLLAHPTDDRFHKKIIPMGGGISIFLTILLACLTVTVFIEFFMFNQTTELFGRNFELYIQGFAAKTIQLWIAIGCAAVLFLLGMWDDMKNLGPVPKLVVEFAVAFAAAYWGDVRVEFFIESRLLTSILSTFWIVLIINAFNFLDNMDGTSAGIAIIVSLIMFIIAILSKQAFVACFAMVFSGTLAGFLVFNFYPASIFMGDAGSLVVGFFVALLTLKTTYYNSMEDIRWYNIIMPLVIMAIPLYDFISVTALRIRQGKSPFVGDTQHFSHRLKRLGLTEVQAVLTLYLATIATGLGAVVLKETEWPYGVLVFLQTIMVLGIIAVLESMGKNGNKQTN